MPMNVHASWRDALASQPETGMGYQVLELQGAQRTAAYAIVLNGIRIHETRRGPLVVREGMGRADEERILRALEGSVGRASFRVLSRTQAVRVRVLESELAGLGPASEAPIEDSKREERFLRFSAFADDIRIRGDGSVTPGTYVTTFADGMMNVKTGTDAVRRYALPNPEPAVHRYYLRPPRSFPFGVDRCSQRSGSREVASKSSSRMALRPVPKRNRIRFPRGRSDEIATGTSLDREARRDA